MTFEARKQLTDALQTGVPPEDQLYLDFGPLLAQWDIFFTDAGPKFHSGLQTLGLCSDTPTLADYYRFGTMCIEAIAQHKSESLCIVDLVSSIRQRLHCSQEDANTVWSSLCHISTALIGLLTLLFRWHASSTDEQMCVTVQCSKPVTIKRQNLSVVTNRPIGSMIRIYSCLPIRPNSFPDTQHLLHLSSLQIWSLISIGRIEIIWTEYLGSHLSFNSQTRELKIFKYPSLCAAMCQDSDPAKFYSKYVKRLRIVKGAC